MSNEETYRDLVTASSVYDEPHNYDEWETDMAALIRVADLTSEESYVLTRRNGTMPRTLEQVAGEMGVSRETVRRHEIAAFAKLENILGREIVLKG